MTQIFGIVNVTRDSFSDGGRFLEADEAVRHGLRLVAGGADYLDIGAESTHPDAEDVPAEVEIARLTPVITRLRERGIGISVDTTKPAVMRAVLPLGVAFINDVSGFADGESVRAVRDAAVRLIVMHARHRREHARAERIESDAETIVGHVCEFFRRRTAELIAAGIAAERLILDPGMGLFLGSDPAVSLAMLRGLPKLAELGFPLLVSTSRKGFIGALLGAEDQRRDAGRPAVRPAAERGAGTLATELWAVRQGASYIRTHDPGQLRDALTIQTALTDAED